MTNFEANDATREKPQQTEAPDNFNDFRNKNAEKANDASEIALAGSLVEKKQLAPGLVIDALLNKPDVPLEQALPQMLTERKEEMFKKQQELPKESRPPLGQMMVDEGLVTKEQVKEALDTQKALRDAGKKAPLLGDLLVQQLEQHISDAKQAGTKK